MILSRNQILCTSISLLHPLYSRIFHFHWSFACFYRKIIDTLSYEEKNLISRVCSGRPISAPELSNQWRKEFGELLKIREKYLCQIKLKKDTIAKLETKIRALEGETKVLSFYSEGKTVLMDENIGKSVKQIQLLQNKLYNVS